MKRCTGCGELKARSEFGIRRRKGREGRAARCLDCCRKADAAYRAINPGALRARVDRYRARYPDKIRERARRVAQQNRAQRKIDKKFFVERNIEHVNSSRSFGAARIGVLMESIAVVWWIRACWSSTMFLDAASRWEILQTWFTEHMDST